MTALAKVADKPLLPAAIEQVLVGGDLSKLSPDQRLHYYKEVCESLGLNPLTKPFAYITLNGKQTLYALKDATEQLRKIHGVSITECTSQRIDDVFVVTAKAQDKSGRTDAATGAVAVANLRGEALANALMKAETKAKRRATLSICGLGVLDETELETIPQVQVTVHDNDPEPPKTDPAKDAKLLEHAKATTEPLGAKAVTLAIDRLVDKEEATVDHVTMYCFRVESDAKLAYVTKNATLAAVASEFVGADTQVSMTYKPIKGQGRKRELKSIEEAPNQNDPLVKDEDFEKKLPVQEAKPAVTVGNNSVECQIAEVTRLAGPASVFRVLTTDQDSFYCKDEAVATFLKNCIGGTATVQIRFFEEKGRQVIEQAVTL